MSLANRFDDHNSTDGDSASRQWPADIDGNMTVTRTSPLVKPEFGDTGTRPLTTAERAQWLTAQDVSDAATQKAADMANLLAATAGLPELNRIVAGLIERDD